MWRRILVGVGCLVIIGWLIITSREPSGLAGKIESGHLTVQPQTYRSEQVLSVDTFWQPTKGRARGVLWLFHGCNHGGSHFFQFPEGQQIIQSALQRGFIPVAFSSADRTGSQCWNTSPGGGPSDLSRIAPAMQMLIRREGWGSLVHIGLGVSSGGHFLSQLPRMTASFMQFRAAVIMISPGAVDAFRALSTPAGEYPQVAWVHLTPDVRMTSLIQQSSSILSEKRVPQRIWSLDIRTPITEAFLRARIPWKGQSHEAELVALLKEQRLLDSEGYLQSPSAWQSAVFSAPYYQPSQKEYFLEAFNVAFGHHEITSQQFDEIFTWCISG